MKSKFVPDRLIALTLLAALVVAFIADQARATLPSTATPYLATSGSEKEPAGARAFDAYRPEPAAGPRRADATACRPAGGVDGDDLTGPAAR